MSIKCTIVPVTPYQQNCSIIRCETTGKAAIVDPGGDVGRILAAVKGMGGTGAVISGSRVARASAIVQRGVSRPDRESGEAHLEPAPGGSAAERPGPPAQGRIDGCQAHQVPGPVGPGPDRGGGA